MTPRDILDSYGSKITDALRENLKEKDRYASGTLWQSIIATTRVMGQRIELIISMNDYWKFVDEGVDGTEKSHSSPYKFKKGGKPIPKDAMIRFIGTRGIQPSMNIKRNQTIQKLKSKKLKKALKKDSKKRDLESAAFAIGVNIKKKGIKPTYFATEVFEGDIIDKLTKDLTEAVGREIKLEVTKVIS